MAESVVKLQRNKNITLPTWLIRSLRVEAGDFIRLEETEEGVLLRRAKAGDPEQAYFWTPEWQEGESEAEEDIRRGRVKDYSSVEELIRDLDG